MPGKKNPFIITNSDRSDESDTHWWIILNISPKSELLFFDSFGISGMKRFVVTDDKKIVEKVLKWLELADKKDDKLTLIKRKFSMNGYKKLAEKEIFNLSSAAKGFFHLICSFGKNKNIKNFVNVWMLEDPIKMYPTVTCGPFRLYFYENLFFPDENSKLQNYKKFTNITLETQLNELFTLDRENNEQITNEYMRKRQIKMT